MVYKYRMNVWWSPEDGAWLVEVPELAGAMADGATPEEAIANVQETIRLWIAVAREDGREVPEPEALAASKS
jgi:predicted RNase H-like HicB family nuclease